MELVETYFSLVDCLDPLPVDSVSLGMSLRLSHHVLNLILPITVVSFSIWMQRISCQPDNQAFFDNRYPARYRILLAGYPARFRMLKIATYPAGYPGN
jgi:hypothetical protein